MRCRYLGGPLRTTVGPFGLEPVYECLHEARCETTAAGCSICPDYRRHNAPFHADDFDLLLPPATSGQPSGTVLNRWGEPAGVRDLYYGAHCFLVLGGPSLKTMPLHLLSRRGVLIMSVNNCPAGLPPGIRPHIWLHTDPCRKFHDSIWRDPGILKFTPVREWGIGKRGQKCIRSRAPTGELVNVEGLAAKDCPGVLGFERNTEFQPEEWLFERTINRGNDKEHSDGPKSNGYPSGINTMYAALRLAFYLGIRHLYLLGADFRMSGETPYAFNQSSSRDGRDNVGVSGNNNAYKNMCVCFDELRPRFEAEGFHVFNVTPGSHLWSFEFLDFEEAIERATRHFEQSLDCSTFYDPEPKK